MINIKPTRLTPQANTLLTITNNKGDIVDTNYWQTEWAKQGRLFMSSYAGTSRLLVPPNLRSSINNMRRGAKHVVISTGIMCGRECVEWLFEDDTDTPFAIHIEAYACDVLFRHDNTPREWKASVWDKQNGLLIKCFELPAYWRHVAYLPCLKPIK